jgi:glycerophosphoryl diester phosphodiesterase
MAASERFRLPPVIGHRGAAGLAPENTLPGLEAAAAAGCTWVEVDVMVAACGTPVLHHDITLIRLEGLRARVDGLSYAELAELDPGAAFSPAFAGTRIPTLETALAAMRRFGLRPNLEIKPPPGREAATARAVVACARACWPRDLPPPLISSFRRTSLRAARDAAPDWPRGLIAQRRPLAWRALLRELGCVSLHLGARDLKAKWVEQARAEGYAVAAYTVNDAATAAHLRAWGVDSLITDRPDVVR